MVMDQGRRRRLLSALPATVVMALVLLVFSGCAAPQNNVSLTSIKDSAAGSGTLTAALTPEGTNTSGSGTARLRLNPERQTICYTLRVSGIELPATGAHLHRGTARINGPDVVSLTPPNAQGLAVGCAHASHDLIAAIMQHPANYYVTVHNALYPDGALRGQLSACGAQSGC